MVVWANSACRSLVEPSWAVVIAASRRWRGCHSGDNDGAACCHAAVPVCANGFWCAAVVSSGASEARTCGWWCGRDSDDNLVAACCHAAVSICANSVCGAAVISIGAGEACAGGCWRGRHGYDDVAACGLAAMAIVTIATRDAFVGVAGWASIGCTRLLRLRRCGIAGTGAWLRRLRLRRRRACCGARATCCRWTDKKEQSKGGFADCHGSRRFSFQQVATWGHRKS